MAPLGAVEAYICRHCHNKADLLGRLTKIAYLADWRSAITRGKQISSARWFLSSFGPHAECESRLEADPDTLISSLSSDDKDAIDYVIRIASRMSSADLSRLVHSTYPVLTQEKHIALNLPELAGEYQDAIELQKA